MREPSGFPMLPAVSGHAITAEMAAAAVDTTGLAGHQRVTDWHLLNLATRRHDAVLVTFDRKLAQGLLAPDDTRIVTLA